MSGKSEQPSCLFIRQNNQLPAQSSRHRGHFSRTARLALASSFLAINVTAYGVDWIRAAGNPGDIGTGANWAGGSVPNNLDALINNGGIATTSASSPTFLTLGLGTTPGGSGTIQQTGGTITSTGNMTMGDTGSSGNLYNISAGTLSVGFGVTTGEMIVGAGGAGTLNLSGSGVVDVKNFLRFGNTAAGAGTLLMSGGSLNVFASANSGSIHIGNNGVGTAVISGGTITTRFFNLGQSTTGSGHVTQTGGVVNATRNMVMAELKPFVENAPQFASDYTMSGGAISVGSQMYIGAHGSVTFNLSGTGSITIGGVMHIGSSGNGAPPPEGDGPQGYGTLNMSGGSIAVTGSNAQFIVGENGLGTLNLSGGAITSKFFNLGQNPGGRGLVNHTGGTVTVQNAFVIGETSLEANLYDLSGGAVIVQQSLLSPGNANIGSGGGTGTIKIRNTGALSADNSVILGGAAGSNGTMEISGGSVTVGANGAGTGVCLVGNLGSGTLLVSGGSLTAPLMTLGQNASATGVGTQTGGSVAIATNLSIGEASTNANAYDISAGSLSVGSAIFIGTTGNGTLRVSGSALISADAIQNGTTGIGTILVSGGSLTANTTHNPGLYAQTGGTASLGVVDSAGQIQISAGTLAAASIAQGTLALSGTARVNITPGGGTAGTSVVKTLSVTGTSKLNLADHDLIVDYTGASPLADIKALITSGYANGAWNGNGINSSSAAASGPNKTALGYAEASATGFANGTFSDEPIDADAVLVKYTYSGDANLNGTVDSTDFNLFTPNYGGSGKSWIQGDFDYNGKVNTLDFNLLAGNFGLALPGPTLGSVVPEPASMSIVGLAIIAALRRRR